MALTTVIVTFNSAEVIGPCLEALNKMAPECKTIVVDNASADRTSDLVHGAELISNQQNLGFAAAANQGFRAASGDCVLLLNPDVRLRTAIDPAISACRAHGLAAGLLTNDAGEPQAGFCLRRLPTAATLVFELLGLNRLWRWNPVNRRYRCLDLDLSQPQLVEQPAGAFLMVRRDVWEQLGGFDEDFHPVWFEDVDFCKRALDAGFEIAFRPEVTAAHEGGHSVRRLSPRCQTVYWYDSLLKYAAKHFRPMPYWGVSIGVMLGSVGRAVAGTIRERSLGPIMVCGEILSMTGRRLVSRTQLERNGL